MLARPATRRPLPGLYLVFALTAACAVPRAAGPISPAPSVPPPAPTPEARPAAAPAEAIASAEAAGTDATDALDPGSEPAPPPTPVTHPYHSPLPDRRAPNAPAMHNAQLSPEACRKEVARRKLPVVRDNKPTPGVATAYRLKGKLGSVQIQTGSSTTPYGVLDCRLVLTLDDLAPLLARHDVAALRIDNAYRPHSKLGRSKPSQHAHALAIDVTTFSLSDGRVLHVERDWKADIGDPVCGPSAVMQEPSDESVRLRNLVCDIVAAGLFHHVLTPSYDAAHRDHLHLDIKRTAWAVILR